MAVAALLALLLAGPAGPGAELATGDEEPGPGPAPAGIGTDVSGLAFDPAGRLYVADRRGDRIVVLGPATEVLGVIGADRLDDPTGVAAAPGGDVLVTDDSGVTRFTADGTPVAAWAADAPAGIAVAPDGTVYVSERGEVAVFSGTGAPLGAFAADDPHGIAVALDGSLWLGAGDSLVHVTPAGAALGSTPAPHAEGVALAPDGGVLVAERELDRVVRVTPGGGPADATGVALHEPRGVAVDCRGNMAVADDSRQRIHRIAALGQPPPPCAAAIASPVPAAPERPVARRPAAVPTPAAALLPVLGRVALTATTAGRVSARLPGGRGPLPLRSGSLVPIGARIDARAGRVELAFATRTGDFDRLGTSQTATVAAGVFSIHQRRGASRVELRLQGARAACGQGAVGRRRLWSDAHGSFRTRGALATVTARSARWLSPRTAATGRSCAWRAGRCASATARRAESYAFAPAGAPSSARAAAPDRRPAGHQAAAS